MGQPQPRRSPVESARNIGLWLLMIAIGLSFIILGFQGRVGSGLAAFFAPSTLAPMNEDGTAGAPANTAGTAAQVAGSVVGSQIVKPVVATPGVAVGIIKNERDTAIGSIAQTVNNLRQTIATMAATAVTNPAQAVAQVSVSLSSIINGLVRFIP